MEAARKKRTDYKDSLLSKIKNKQATISVVGIGYVGLPLACAVASAGFSVTGIDTNSKRLESIKSKESYIHAVSDEVLATLVDQQKLKTASKIHDYTDIVILCVPTPLTQNREPDISYIEKTVDDLKKVVCPGQMIILESTTYPGTTREAIVEIFKKKGFSIGEDLFVAYAPEREDPGNKDFNTSTVPKVIGADDPNSLLLAEAFYGSFIGDIVPVSSLDTAEAVKLTENIFRSVNIALVNEMKTIYDAMGIDIWEVIEAAKTKPYGYMPFYPGPGLGGHCIPIDPFYLTWRARAFEVPTRFVELAGEINTRMPHYVVSRMVSALDLHAHQGLSSASILVLGIAYKKNVSDVRQSPGLKIMHLLKAQGVKTLDYHDPFVPEIPDYEDAKDLAGQKSAAFTKESLAGYSCVLIVTDHDHIDYQMVFDEAPLIIDTRNIMEKSGFSGPKIIKA